MQRSASHPRRPSPSPVRQRTRKHDPSPSPVPNGEPAAVFAALRGLLANAARARFRMTPDEHHRALGLLNALESAVSHPGSNCVLTSLATEILDEIVFYVDSRRDLCALGATCQRFRGIVYPRHVEYRVVQCRPSATHVWRHLDAHPLLARNVRRLHIMDERTSESEIIPKRAKEHVLANDPAAEGLEMHAIQQRLIVLALARMTTLVSFSWACNSSLVSFDDVAPTLLTCASLREVEITDNMFFSPLSAVEDSEAPRVRKEPPDLTSVAIRSARSAFGATSHPSLERVQNLLIANCPSLTILRIGYNHRRPFIPRADDFLLRGRWPALRTLSLQNLWCSPAVGFDAAAAFLAAHPHVETLHFELGRVQLELPVGTLPRLRELMCSRDVAAAILACRLADASQERPLEVLRGMRIGGGRDAILMAGLRRCPGLRRVELQGYGEIDDVKRLAEVAPKMTWLDVGRRSSGPAKSSAAAVPSVNEWAPVLSALPELTAFHGVNFFYEADADAASQSDRSRIKKNDEVASMLAWKCPRLRRVDCWPDASGRVVVLGKEGEKFKWEVRRPKS